MIAILLFTKENMMKNTINLLRVIHGLTLATLLSLVAVIPLIININIVPALIVLPTLLIIIFALSIIIDQKLLSLVSKHKTVKSSRRCLIFNCLHKVV